MLLAGASAGTVVEQAACGPTMAGAVSHSSNGVWPPAPSMATGGGGCAEARARVGELDERAVAAPGDVVVREEAVEAAAVVLAPLLLLLELEACRSSLLLVLSPPAVLSLAPLDAGSATGQLVRRGGCCGRRAACLAPAGAPPLSPLLLPTAKPNAQ